MLAAAKVGQVGMEACVGDVWYACTGLLQVRENGASRNLDMFDSGSWG